MYIYTITTFEELDNEYGGIAGSSRCVGYYDNFKDADEVVKNNLGDIFETIYNYAVIEKVEAGLYPACLERQFYKIHVENDDYRNVTYEPIDEPECVKCIVNFAIG